MGKAGSDDSPVPLPRDQPDFAAGVLGHGCLPTSFLSVEAAPLPPRQGPDALGRVTLKIPVKKSVHKSHACFYTHELAAQTPVPHFPKGKG